MDKPVEINCNFCGEETDRLILVNSPSISNALVSVCMDCSASFNVDDVTVKCNKCDVLLKINESDGAYMEQWINENTFFMYCEKCKHDVWFDNIKKCYIIKNEKKYMKRFKNISFNYYTMLERVHKAVVKMYPCVNLMIHCKKGKFVIDPDIDDPDTLLKIYLIMYDACEKHMEEMMNQ